MKQILSIFVVAAFVVGCASTDSLPSLADMAGFYFPNEKSAIGRGTALAKSIGGGQPSRWQPDERVCFLGTVAGTGATPDIHPAIPSEDGTYFGSLQILTNVVVRVTITTGKDVRPQAVGWGAALLGTLNSIDAPNKIIGVSVDPENWKVTEAW